MNSSIDIDKKNLFLGYYYGLGELLSKGYYSQPGMYFINGETNSIWVWDALERRWIDTNRVDSGLKGMLTDREGNSPADYQPNQTKGIKESYFYVAECEDVEANPNAKNRTITFTYFKNGASSVSVTVKKTSIVCLYWNGDYWETSVVPMNVDLSKLAKDSDLKAEIDRSSAEDEVINTIIEGGENSFSDTFYVTFEGKSLPFVIPKGATIYLRGDVTKILAYSNKSSSDFATINNGDIADRNITYIKNTNDLGDLTLSFSYKGVIPVVTYMSKNLEELNSFIYGGNRENNLNLVTSPAYIDLQERNTGYFKGYKVELTQYVGKYDEVYFRGAEWDYPLDETHITRGLILDKEGNVESIVPYVETKSNGWQSLPITENSKTLWATYCTKSEGGEVWSPEYVIFRSVGKENLLDKFSKLNTNVDIILPSDIYILQGQMSQLFFRGFIKAVNPYDYDIKVMCDVGKTFPRYYEIGRNVALGDYPIKIQVRNDALDVLGEATSVLHIVDKGEVTNHINVLCLGDSTAVSGCWAAELGRMIDSTNVLFVGSKKGTSEDVMLEATPGWTWKDFIEENAPFAYGDFKTYAETHCKGEIDVLITHLGVNSSLWENSNEKKAIDYARQLIEGYFADFPNGKMIITAIPMPDEGTNVYENSERENNINRYGTISSFLRYNDALYKLVMELKSAYNIYYAPTNIFFDTDYGYPKEYKSVNTRMDEFKEMVGVNGVHPTPKGSYMIADGILPLFYEKIVK